MAVMLTWVLAVTVLTAGPILWLRLRHGAARHWFLLGIASWILAVLGKTAVHSLFDAMGLHEDPSLGQAILDGLMSGAWELGMAALFLRGRSLSTANVLAFGTGLGCFEVLAVAGIGLAQVLDGSAEATFLGLLFFMIERSITLLGHVASRVLIYVALRRRWLLPACLALAIFTLVDGAASYGWAAGWDWDDNAVLGRFYVGLAVVEVLEVAFAWWYWRELRRTTP